MSPSDLYRDALGFAFDLHRTEEKNAALFLIRKIRVTRR